MFLCQVRADKRSSPATGAHGLHLCWKSHSIIFDLGNCEAKQAGPYPEKFKPRLCSITSLWFLLSTRSSERAAELDSVLECRLLTPVLSLCHVWLIAWHHSSKDQSHPKWPFSRCLLGLQWCPLFVDLGSQAFLGFSSKKKKKTYSGRWYIYCDRRKLYQD